jgi:hypothetical protein
VPLQRSLVSYSGIRSCAVATPAHVLFQRSLICGIFMWHFYVPMSRVLLQRWQVGPARLQHIGSKPVQVQKQEAQIRHV